MSLTVFTGHRIAAILLQEANLKSWFYTGKERGFSIIVKFELPLLRATTPESIKNRTTYFMFSRLSNPLLLSIPITRCIKPRTQHNGTIVCNLALQSHFTWVNTNEHFAGFNFDSSNTSISHQYCSLIVDKLQTPNFYPRFHRVLTFKINPRHLNELSLKCDFYVQRSQNTWLNFCSSILPWNKDEIKI